MSLFHLFPEHIFTGYRICNRQIFSFCTGKMLYHILLAPRVSEEKAKVICVSLPSIQWVPSLWQFSRFFSLSFIFGNLIRMLLGMNFFWFILPGVHRNQVCGFTEVIKSGAIIFLSVFRFYLFLSLWNANYMYVRSLNIAPWVTEAPFVFTVLCF